MNPDKTTTNSEGDRPSPERIGAYRILDVLGEGGMGTVYLAEQEHPIRRRVALKVIKPGMDSREVLARFSSERQALAMMTHPNIAKVFDAGWTGTGHPYFVMELVQGIAITKYCDQHRLTTRERIALFATVCDALHHAHQKGIVHRDIKPSNVLVSVSDGAAAAHVIDFGIAKALTHSLVESTIHTQQGLLIGTPAYMSPEQANTGGLGVDTTSDVYSLGILLYELLVGALPFDPGMLHKAGYLATQRIICEEVPLRPSTRFRGLGQSAAAVATRRRTDALTLEHELAADLDWVVTKAIEKDRTRRYQSASEFAADLRRYLNGDPVIARPPSFSYRASKLIRKHWAAAAATAVVAGAVIGGLTISIAMYLRSEGAREQAHWQANLAAIAAADAQIQASESGSPELIANAQSRLASIPGEDRNWEWGYLARKTDSTVGTLWGTTDPNVIFKDTAGAVYFGPLSVSSEGRNLFWSTREGVHAWDISARRLSAAWPGYGAVRALSPDGSKLLSHDWRSARPWRVIETRSGVVIATLPIDPHSVVAAAFAADGNHLATVDDSGSAQLWGSETFELLDRVEIGARPTLVRLSGGETPVVLIAAGEDLHVWRRAPEAVRLGTFRGVSGTRLVSADLSKSGDVIVAAYSSGAIRLWREPSEERRFVGNHSDVTAVALAPDGQLVATGGIQGEVRIWNTRMARADERPVRPMIIDDTSHGLVLSAADRLPISALLFLPESQLLVAASGRGVLRLWDVATARLEAGVPLRYLLDGPDQVSDILAVSKNGRFALSTALPTAAIRQGPPNTDSATPGKRPPRVASLIDLQARTSANLPPFTTGARIAAMNSTGDRWVIAGTDSRVYVRSQGVSEPVSIPTPPGVVRAVAMDSEGRRVAVASLEGQPADERERATNSGQVRVWDSVAAQELGSFSADSVQKLSFDRSGNWLLVSTATRDVDCRASARLWDVNRSRFAVEIDRCAPLSALSATGERLVTYSVPESRIEVWNARTGALIAASDVVFGLVALAVNADGSRIAALVPSNDPVTTPGTVLVLDGRTAVPLLAISDAWAIGSQLQFTDDGQGLIVVSLAGSVRRIDASGSWRAEVRALARRLSDGDFQMFPSLRILASPERFADVQTSVVSGTDQARSTWDSVRLSEELIQQIRKSSGVEAQLKGQLIEELERVGDWDLAALCRASNELVAKSKRTREDYGRALRMAGIVANLAPWSAHCMGVLAIAQYRTGDYEGVLRTLDRVAALQEVPATAATAAKVMALYGLGRAEEARALARRLRESPDWREHASSDLYGEVERAGVSGS